MRVCTLHYLYFDVSYAYIYIHLSSYDRHTHTFLYIRIQIYIIQCISMYIIIITCMIYIYICEYVYIFIYYYYINILYHAYVAGWFQTSRAKEIQGAHRNRFDSRAKAPTCGHPSWRAPPQGLGPRLGWEAKRSRWDLWKFGWSLDVWVPDFGDFGRKHAKILAKIMWRVMACHYWML